MHCEIHVLLECLHLRTFWNNVPAKTTSSSCSPRDTDARLSNDKHNMIILVDDQPSMSLYFDVWEWESSCTSVRPTSVRVNDWSREIASPSINTHLFILLSEPHSKDKSNGIIFHPQIIIFPAFSRSLVACGLNSQLVHLSFRWCLKKSGFHITSDFVSSPPPVLAEVVWGVGLVQMRIVQAVKYNPHTLVQFFLWRRYDYEEKWITSVQLRSMWKLEEI